MAVTKAVISPQRSVAGPGYHESSSKGDREKSSKGWQGMENGDGFVHVIGRIDQHRLYRTREVATLLQCSMRYVQVLVELGRLEALRVGRFVRIPGEELVRFINKYKEWDGRDGSNCKLPIEK